VGVAELSNEDLARQARDEFDRGVAARRNGERSRQHFLAAALAFDQLRLRGVRSPDLERSAGNAYFLADDLPRAILAYRRGLRLAPDDRGLRDNLEEARVQVLFLEGSSLGRAPEDLRPAWLPYAPRSLFALAVAGYAVCCLAVARWFMLRQRQALLVASAALAVAAGASLLSASPRPESSRPVVVIAATGVQLRKGDGWGFLPRYETPVNKGVEAQLLYRSEDGWMQVELSGGEVGWVAPSEAVAEDR
jgi:hypothetical protein